MIGERTTSTRPALLPRSFPLVSPLLLLVLIKLLHRMLHGVVYWLNDVTGVTWTCGPLLFLCSQYSISSVFAFVGSCATSPYGAYITS